MTQVHVVRNPDHIHAVADAIENRTIPGVAFYMPAYFLNADSTPTGHFSGRDHDCKTGACMAGFSYLITHGKENKNEAYDSAMEAMGITDSEADYLFRCVCSECTDKEAVQHLRQIAEGGPADWSKINPEYLSWKDYEKYNSSDFDHTTSVMP